MLSPKMSFYLYMFIVGNQILHPYATDSQYAASCPCKAGEDCCDELREENLERMMEIQRNQLSIEENTMAIKDLKSENAQLKQLLEEKIEKFSCENTFENNLGKKVCKLEQDLYNAVPLGTIIPWVNKPSLDATHQEDIPEGWQLCDGSLISGGIWSGYNTPDLNNDGRFLRGGRIQDVLLMEDSILQNHFHEDDGHVHTDAGHTHADTGHSHGYQHIVMEDGGNSVGGDAWDWANLNLHNYKTTIDQANIESSKANINIAQSHIGGVKTDEGVIVGTETRPTNMRVLWIIKVE